MSGKEEKRRFYFRFESNRRLGTSTPGSVRHRRGRVGGKRYNILGGRGVRTGGTGGNLTGGDEVSDRPRMSRKTPPCLQWGRLLLFQ